jgi:undecaprenyl-diphosphatase
MDLEVLLLGLLQGITEFLPVSSSGHLNVAKIMMGVRGPSLSFDLVLHAATLLAVFVYFAKDIAALLLEWIYGFFNANARNWAGWRFGWAVVLGTLVTGPLGILLKPVVETASANLLWLGGNFWLTGLLLLSTKFFKSRRETVRPRDGLFVGLIQGLAVLPGISRSGATIWAGLLGGLSRDEAFRFSFLLSIPAILGATLLESRELGGVAAFLAELPSDWIAAAGVAFLSGLISLVILRRLVTSDKWWLFSIYCILFGSASVVLSIVGV